VEGFNAALARGDYRNVSGYYRQYLIREVAALREDRMLRSAGEEEEEKERERERKRRGIIRARGCNARGRSCLKDLSDIFELLHIRIARGERRACALPCRNDIVRTSRWTKYADSRYQTYRRRQFNSDPICRKIFRRVNVRARAHAVCRSNLARAGGTGVLI